MQSVPQELEPLVQATTDELAAQYRASIDEIGYNAFGKLAEACRTLVKTYGDADLEFVATALKRAERLFPNPGIFSPSWASLWQELQEIVSYKNEALREIPLIERSGEWQVVMDNPLTNQDVVCYPALSFEDAVYLYGYFRRELEPNEYIRLQKVATCLLHFGGAG